MSQEINTQDVAQDEEQREELVWVNQTPTTRIEGDEIESVIYAGDFREAQNGTSFGIVFKNPRVTKGTLYRNTKKPEGGVTVVDEETEKRATDYRVVDLDDRGVTTIEMGGQTMVTDRANQSYEPVEEFEEDRVLVWYNGMSGQIVGRGLDFNGRPFAQYKDDGYLVKGLFQVAQGWRNGNKRDMVKNGFAPRVVRAPILRPDVEGKPVSVEIGRWNGGRMYECTIEVDGEELDMRYAEDADDVLQEAGFQMHLHHGDGWQDKPANAQDFAPAPEGGFNIEVGQQDRADTSDSGLSPAAQQFVQDVAQALEGTDLQPDDAFNGGISGLMSQHGVEADEAAVKAAIYEAVSYLDSDDL